MCDKIENFLWSVMWKISLKNKKTKYASSDICSWRCYVQSHEYIRIVYVCVYILYIHTYVHTYIHAYIYIYNHTMYRVPLHFRNITMIMVAPTGNTIARGGPLLCEYYHWSRECLQLAFSSGNWTAEDDEQCTASLTSTRDEDRGTI